MPARPCSARTGRDTRQNMPGRSPDRKKRAARAALTGTEESYTTDTVGACIKYDRLMHQWLSSPPDFLSSSILTSPRVFSRAISQPSPG